MANALYTKGRQKFLDGDLDWSAHNIIVLLVDATYVQDLAADEFISSIGAAEVDRSGNLSGKTVVAGVADAANETLTAVTGAQVTRLVIARDTGNDATSPLIAYIDSGTNLPVTPNGGDLQIQWDNGANKIFKL